MRLFTLAFALAFTAFGHSQFVEIPDDNFSLFLNNIYPECMDGNMMDTTCVSITSTVVLDCSFKDISDLEGLQYFDNLEELFANSNLLTSIPPLPGNYIYHLWLNHNLITEITDYPEGVYVLSLENNPNLVSIAPYPESLAHLYVSSCTSLTSIPALTPEFQVLRRKSTPDLAWVDLPEGLVEINVADCDLTSIPDLPDSILRLYLTDNNIGNLTAFPPEIMLAEIGNCGMTALPEIPATMQILDCSNQEITELPLLSDMVTLEINDTSIDSLFLPQSLRSLLARNGILSYINWFPSDLNQIDVINNNLDEIPLIPEEVTVLSISDNNISCLQNLPEVLFLFYFEDNPLTCFPSLPNVSVSSSDGFEDMPLCIEGDLVNNPNSCTTAFGVEGFVQLDLNDDCLSNDDGLSNFQVNIYNGEELIGATSTLHSGRYYKSIGLGEYQVELEIENTPFTTNCPFPGLDSLVTLDITSILEDSINFSLTCMEGHDIGTQSAIVDGWVFPGENHKLTSFTGDMSSFYNANCGAGVSGTVTIQLLGPVEIESILSEALIPSITDLTLVYEIEDFGTLDLATDFGMLLNVNTDAQDGDGICAHVTVTSNENDYQPGNDDYWYCYLVVNSYDPNNKTVYPYEVLPGFDDWLIYTINFQNTGSAPAFNIRLEDQLSESLDISTFHMTNTSHESYFELSGHDLTIHYPEIMLADSSFSEPDSKGYFQFRIKPSSPIVVGAPVNNSASIFFDFNDPIITNTAVTQAILPDGVSEFESANIKLYPNPSDGIITIESTKKVQNISAANLLGEEIEFKSNSSNDAVQLSFGPNTKGLVIIRLETDNGVYFEKVFLN